VTDEGWDSAESEVRTFLIADIRGYTRFTQTQGDEAAGRLAARFAALVEDTVPDRGGRLLELRGDEALVVFGSPRQAIRCALELQQRFVEATLADPELPFGVGIGIDFGEAVAVGDGYRGGALNMAARLCSIAGPGEVLATSEATHVARRIEGINYVERNHVQLKGIDDPPRVMRVVSSSGDVAANPAFRAAVDQTAAASASKRRQEARRSAIAGGAVLTLLIAAVVVVVVRSGGGHGLPEIGSNAVGAVSIHGNKLHRRVLVGASPGAVATEPDAVWVANSADNTVTRVDLKDSTAPANTVPVGNDPSGLAVGGGALWVTNADDRTVSRINSESRSVVDTIKVGVGPSGIAYGADRVWVANLIDDTVMVIDPSSDKVLGTIAVQSQPTSVAVGFGSVWVANAGSSLVSRIDPKTLLVTSSVGVGNGPDAITIDRDSVWVTNSLDDTASHIDPSTNRVVATVSVGRSPTGAAASGDAVWVSNSNSDTISRIDPTADKVVQTVKVGNAPEALAVTKTDVWVSARGSAAQHVGGTLRVVGGEDQIVSLDPQLAYSNFAWSILSITNDGLVTFRRTAGPAGATVVPDLATDLPTTSDNGTTYAFRLRSGVRYSDGALIKPSDFRATFERRFRVFPDMPFYDSIVGASSCSKNHCDLSRGIVTDDAAGTVVFHLTTSDPEFLYKLALPFADVMPKATPARDLGFEPHIGTGPYVISSHTGRQLVLTRNKWFQVWSSPAQPAGYPDRIEVTLAKSVNGSAAPSDVNAVVQGKYDWTGDGLPQELLPSLLRTRTSQLHPYDGSATHYYFLNAREKPFTDVRVRQAVNFALDRRAIVAGFGGSHLSYPTCQLLPPTISGYRPYCPYTVHPNSSGIWSGPDLARARALVRSAHAVGAKVTVWVRPDRPDIGAIVVRAMRSTGLDARPYEFPDHGAETPQLYFDAVDNLSHHVQTGLEGWSVDYPAPSNLIAVLMRCDAITPTNNLNAAAFCDHGIDAQMDKALAQQATDPAGAAVAWARIDREITDRAPWLSLENDRAYDVLSKRAGNYQHNPEWGVLLDQLWVQ
jgi:peptide/nickel transport system substrate-binding protein